MKKVLDNIFIFGLLALLGYLSVIAVYEDKSTPIDGILVDLLKYTRDQIRYYVWYIIDILWMFRLK